MNSNIITKLIERARLLSSEYQADYNFINSLYSSIKSTSSGLQIIKRDPQLASYLDSISVPTNSPENLVRSLEDKKFKKEFEVAELQRKNELENITSTLLYIEKIKSSLNRNTASGKKTIAELEKLEKSIMEYRQRLNGFEQRNITRRTQLMQIGQFTGINPLGNNFTENNISSSQQFKKQVEQLNALVKLSETKAKVINDELKALSRILTGKEEVPDIKVLIDLAKKKGDRDIDKRINVLLNNLYEQRGENEGIDKDGLIIINKRIRGEEQALGISPNKIGEIDYNRKSIPITPNTSLQSALREDPINTTIGSKNFTKRAQIAAALETNNESTEDTKIDIKKFIRELTNNTQYKDTYEKLVLEFTELVKNNEYEKINEVISTYRQGRDLKLLGVVKAARKAALESKWDTDRSPKVMLLPVESLSENIDEPLLPYATEIISEEGGIDPSGAINSELILANPAKKKIIEAKIRNKLYTHRIGYELSGKIGGHLVRKMDNVSSLRSSKIDIKGSEKKLDVLTLLSREIALDLSEEITRVFDRNVEISGGNLFEARRVTTEYLETKLKDTTSIGKSVEATVERVRREYQLNNFEKITQNILNEVAVTASDGIRATIEGEAFTIVPDSILRVKILSESDNKDSPNSSVLEVEEEVLANSRIGKTILASQKGVDTRVQSVKSNKESVNTVKRTQRFVQIPNEDSVIEAIQRIGLEVEEGESVLDYAQKELDIRGKYHANNKDAQMSEMDEEILSALLGGRLIPFLEKMREKNGENIRDNFLAKILGSQNVHEVKGIFDTKENIDTIQYLLAHPEKFGEVLWNKGLPFFDNSPDDSIRNKVRKTLFRSVGLRRKVVLDDGQEREVNVATFYGRRLFANRVDDFSNTRVAKFFGLDKTLKRENRKKKGSILELALSVIGRTVTTLAIKILKRIPYIKTIVERISNRYNSFMSGEGGRLLNKSLATTKVAGSISSAGLAGVQRGAMGFAIGYVVFGPLGGLIGGGAFAADGFMKAIIRGESNIYRTPLMKNIDSWFGAELATRQGQGSTPLYVNKFTKQPTNLGEMLAKNTELKNTPSGLVRVNVAQSNLTGLARLLDISGPIGKFMRGLRVLMAGRYSTYLSLSKSGFAQSLGKGIGKYLTAGKLTALTGAFSSSMLWGTIGYIVFGSNPFAGVLLGASKFGLDLVVSPLIKKGFTAGITRLAESNLGKFISSAFKLPVFESLGFGAGFYTIVDTIKTVFDDTLSVQQKFEAIFSPVNFLTGSMNIIGYVSALRTLPAGLGITLGRLTFLNPLNGSPAIQTAILTSRITTGMFIGSIVGGIVGLFMGGGPATVIFASTAGALIGGLAAGVVSILFPPAGIAVIAGVSAAGGLIGGIFGGAIGRGIDNIIGEAGNFLKLIGVFLGFKKFFSSKNFSEKMAAIVQLALSVGTLGAAGVFAMSVIIPVVTPGILVPLQTNTTAVKSYEKLINPNTLLYSITIKKGVDFSDPKVQNINLNFIDEMDQTKISNISFIGAGSTNFALSSNGKAITYKYQGELKKLAFETLQYQVTLTSPLKDMNVPNGLCNALIGSSNVTFDGKAAVDTQINQNICIDKDGKELKQTKGNRTSFVDNAGLPVSPDAGSMTQCSYAIGGGGSHSTYKAIDIGAPSGTPVTPPLNGVVRLVSYQPNGYGLYIKVEHIVDSGKMETTYGHLSKVNVSVGDTVTSTTVIGEVGTTGNSTGNHLHFETHINGVGVEPCCVIKCFEYKTYSLNNALSCTNKSSAFYTDSRTQCNF